MHQQKPTYEELELRVRELEQTASRQQQTDRKQTEEKLQKQRYSLEKAEVIFDTQGAAVSAIGFTQDITARKQLEEERVKASRLESIGLLAGGIAHDFNNILGVIMAKASLAGMKVKKNDALVVCALMDEIEQAVTRAGELTRQLLSFSKGGAPVKTTVQASSLLKETVEFALSGSKVQCDFRIAESLWTIDADAGQIHQVLNNLVINACQAMPDGGLLEVEADNAVVDRQYGLPLEPGRYITIRLRDHGIGIPEEHLSKIFDLYFTTRQGGNGLGLTTAFSIVKRHDGHIAVENRPGAGAVFTVYLPASAEVPAQHRAAVTSSAMNPCRVLVMDDDPQIRHVVIQLLEHFHHDVVAVADGAEAVRAYSEALHAGQPFDIVLLDLTVPGGTGGKEAIEQLRQMNPGVKAIVVSGYAHDPVMSDFKSYGFSGMVSKPYRIAELQNVLQNVLRMPES